MYTIYDYLQRTVAANPQKLAMNDLKSTMTFSQLDAAGESIAAAVLQRLQGQRSRPVIIYMNKSVQEVAAFVGVVYAGCFYVPLDVRQPVSRVERMCRVMEAPILITTERLMKELQPLELPGCEILLYEEIVKTPADPQAVACQQKKIIDTDPLYVKFTSGSSGDPKGVVLSHRAVIDYMLTFSEVVGYTPEDISACVSPLHFDNSVHDVYTMFCFGSTMILFSENCFTLPDEFVETINTTGVNVLWWPTSAVSFIVGCEVLRRTKINTNVRVVTILGEVLQPTHCRLLAEHLPGATFYNLYGPTETAVASTWYKIENPRQVEGVIPIGFPFPNTEVLLLNGSSPTVAGEIGEICIRGSSLAGGYYNNTARTAAAFVQNPLNTHYPELLYRTGDLGRFGDRGELYFAGRVDFQIKHQGRRIELGEIEAAVSALPEVLECCVIYRQPQEHAEGEIVLFYSAKEPLQARALLRELLKSIPKYMLPGQLHYLPKLPQNANDKIDRVALGKLL